MGKVDRENNRSRRRGRGGFTLVEMMVTLALTMIMMYLFALIFQITGNFVTRQKGIGENDQSARILTTVLKTDLQARTMRILAPFHPKMPAITGVTFTDTVRAGYFYYSENNPADDTDDVLQFTISTTTLPTGNPVANTPLPGLAFFLPAPWQAGTTYLSGASVRPATATAVGFVFKNKGASFTSGAAGNEPNWAGASAPGQTVSDASGTWTALLSPIDQPDGDDGVIVYDGFGNRTINPAGNNPNNTGASQYAEVSYFLRHGNLYRRILLIRQPYDISGNSTSQPYDADAPAAQLIPGLYPPYPMSPTPAGSGNFWTDFDYAARIQPLNPAGGATGVNFLGVGSAENSLDSTGNAYADPVGTPQIPIGRPDNRFGHDQAYINDGTTAGVRNGPPREYDSNSNSTINNGNPQFFGRYTDEETSNSNFLFPGALPSGGSPMGWTSPLARDPAHFTMSLGNPAATSLAGGTRRGEDILLTNVVSFDVKIWDPLYSETANNQDVNRNGIIDSGPAFADVGHSAPGGCFRGAGSPNGTANAFPEYGPNPNVSSSANYTNNNVFDTWYRYFNFDNTRRTYDNNPADGGPGPPATSGILYAPAPYRPRVGTTWASGATYSPGMLVDPVQTANGYVYQCKVGGTSGTAPAGQSDPFTLQDAIGSTITDGGVTWTVMQPLNVQAIQITVKYLDPTQNLLRQVTIVQSLTQ